MLRAAQLTRNKIQNFLLLALDVQSRAINNEFKMNAAQETIALRPNASIDAVRALVNNSELRAVARQLLKHGGYGRCGEGSSRAARRVTSALRRARDLGFCSHAGAGSAYWGVENRPQLAAAWNTYIDCKKAGITRIS